MGATNLQNGDEITYKKILMFISMTMITSQKCRVINENLHIRGTISVKSVATYLWSQLTYDHKRRISLTWKVSHKLRQEKWNPKLKFQTGRPPIDFIFKPVPRKGLGQKGVRQARCGLGEALPPTGVVSSVTREALRGCGPGKVRVSHAGGWKPWARRAWVACVASMRGCTSPRKRWRILSAAAGSRRWMAGRLSAQDCLAASMSRP